MNLNDATKSALIARLTAMADDELILAQRDAEWTGHAPILEEDIALANIAQDELGHATILYELLQTLTGKSPDEMAFFRDADAFRNAQFLAMPKGDWAFTMLRQYLYDAYEHLLLTAVSHSSYQPLAAAVAKFRNEEMYHLRHAQIWVERLGLGTAESNSRMQRALDRLWPAAQQLFVPMPDDALLTAANIFPDVAALQADWEAVVRPHLQASRLTIPERAPLQAARTEQTAHLAELLAEMQMVARWDPQATW